VNPVTPAACIISQARLDYVIAEYNHELLLKKIQSFEYRDRKTYCRSEQFVLHKDFYGTLLMFFLQNQDIFGSLVLGFLSCQGTHQKSVDYL